MASDKTGRASGVEKVIEGTQLIKTNRKRPNEKCFLCDVVKIQTQGTNFKKVIKAVLINKKMIERFNV